VELKHGRKGDSEGEELLVMKLTARGSIREDEGEESSLEAGLDLGHEVIVQSFKELTSEEAHKQWGLTHERA